MRETRLMVKAPEVRGSGDMMTFCGMPVVYDSWSHFLFRSFYERMMPGCFDESLAENGDVIATIEHSPGHILGRRSAGTLKITSGRDGLHVEVPNSGTSYARDLETNIKNGNVRGMSFIFDDVTDDWGTKDGQRARTVTKAKLYEVSFVTMPCYEDTTAGCRALGESPISLAISIADETDLLARRTLLAEKSLLV